MAIIKSGSNDLEVILIQPYPGKPALPELFSFVEGRILQNLIFSRETIPDIAAKNI